MRAYVGIHYRRPRPDADHALRVAARRSLPFATNGEPDDQWTSPDGRVVLAGWTNEPVQPDRPLLPTVAGDRPGAVGFSGYVHGELPTPSELEDGWVSRGGVWSLFSATPAGLVAQTCASGIELVFWAETADAVVVGNRALLVHLVADPTGPHPDLVGLAGVFNAGYCVTTRTAFTGVTAVPVWSRLAVGRAGAELRTTEARDAVASADEVAEALLASVRPLADADRPVRLGLTGGRDSRLLAALLWRAGVPLEVRTTGSDADPDVVVAREVAQVLGLSHSTLPQRGMKVDGDQVSVDVQGRLKEAVVLADGMLSAYDRVGRVDDTYKPSLHALSGAGGEILRAYFAAGLADLDDEAAATKRLRGRVFQQLGLLTPSVRDDYERDLGPWFEQVRAERGAAMEDFFVRQRMARWAGAAQGSSATGGLGLRPYLDHQVVAAARGVPVPHRTSERLNAELLHRIAPQLSELRYAGRRWAFEQTPPTDPAERAAWEARAPVVGEHGDQASLNWRLDLPEVRDELARVVLEAPDLFWQLADREATVDFVTHPRHPPRGAMMRLWNLATVATALAHDFHADAERRLDSASVTIVTRVPSEEDRAAHSAAARASAARGAAGLPLWRKARRRAGRVLRKARRRLR